MNIGLDLDGTLIDLKIVENLLVEKKINSKLLPKCDYTFSQFPAELREEIFRRFNIPFYMCSPLFAVPYKNVRNKLYEWKREGHKLLLITARNSSIHHTTKRMLNNYFPRFHKIIFVKMGESKERFFKRERLDVWIDDNPNDVHSALKLGIKTYLVSHNNTQYNFEARKLDGIHVVESVSKIIL